MHKLVEIKDLRELKELRDCYQLDWPKNQLGCNTLQNYIKWLEQDDNLAEINVYSLNGNWRETGLYLIVVCMRDNSDKERSSVRVK